MVAERQAAVAVVVAKARVTAAMVAMAARDTA
jgi:hypothetical protein